MLRNTRHINNRSMDFHYNNFNEEKKKQREKKKNWSGVLLFSQPTFMLPSRLRALGTAAVYLLSFRKKKEKKGKIYILRATDRPTDRSTDGPTNRLVDRPIVSIDLTPRLFSPPQRPMFNVHFRSHSNGKGFENPSK